MPSHPPAPPAPPASTAALLAQAEGLQRAGRAAEAIATYQRLLAQAPAQPDAWYNLAYLQQSTRQFDAALASYQHALDHRVSQPEEVRMNRAVIFAVALARPDAALQEVDAALAANPRYLPAWLNRGNLLEQRGDRPGALAAYEQALALSPGHALALSRLPNLVDTPSADDPLVARLQQALARPQATPAERADLGFALGKALDQAGAHDAAFAAYRAANQASRASAGPRGVHYDRSAQEAWVDRLIQADDTPLPTLAAAPQPPRLLFICGLYRSGSTLTEQILASHPQVTSGGELDLLPALLRAHGAAGGASLAPDARTAVRDAYLARLQSLFPGAGAVTDKRMDNFLHIGLILSIFPSARIVVTRRHPLDNGLALYFAHLGHSLPYALDLADIAHWQQQYRRLMDHWHRRFGSALHILDYDALVARPRETVAALLDHCGLPWDDACLRFHEVKNVVQTASAWQVRRPLYTASSGRWRHYERHLEPLRAGLGL